MDGIKNFIDNQVLTAVEFLTICKSHGTLKNFMTICICSNLGISIDVHKGR